MKCQICGMTLKEHEVQLEAHQAEQKIQNLKHLKTLFELKKINNEVNIDSDFETVDGDDDLFAKNVEKEVKDNNEHEDVEDLEVDAALEDGDLELREEVYGGICRTYSKNIMMKLT